jgi:hypothetical protein
MAQLVSGPAPAPIPIHIPDPKTSFYDIYGQPIRRGFSSFINSIFQFLPSFLWSTDYNKDQFPSTASSIETTASGVLGRQDSLPNNPSNAITDSSSQRYVYPVDTCQTVYLVEKHENGRYEVTILYTKELRLNWLQAKLRVILIRILIAEQNISVLNQLFETEGGWKIIGSIDCQRDRSYSVNTFHQDSLLTEFIDVNYRSIFDNFLSDIFSPRPEYFSPNLSPGVTLGTQGPGFKVYSYLTAHFGILDYDSVVAIIAAAVRTPTEYIFTILPPSSAAFRPFLFYLNSIISHATPSQFTQDQIDNILNFYSPPQNQGALPQEFSSLREDNERSLKGALENYNELFDEALEHPRNFRRILGKIFPTETTRISTDKQRKIEKESIKKTKVETTLVRSGDRSSDIVVEPYKTILEKTNELKEFFKNNASLRYLDNIHSDFRTQNNVIDIARITKEYDRLKRGRVSDEEIFENLIQRFDLSPNYYIFASKTFTQAEAEYIADQNIKFQKSNISKKTQMEKEESKEQEPEINALVTNKKRTVENEEKRKIENKESPTIINSSSTDKIRILKIPRGPIEGEMQVVGGKRKSKRNKSKRRRNTKKKYYFKKRRSSQKKNNKKRRSRKR